MPVYVVIKNVFEKNIIPNYARIEIPNTSPASKFTHQSPDSHRYTLCSPGRRAIKKLEK